jgi:hypothetical protein
MRVSGAADGVGVVIEESIRMMGDHDADAARAARVLDRAREILARTAPTPESTAEHEERRRANRAAEIMEEAPPQKPVIYRVNEDALIQPERVDARREDFNRALLAARGKVESGNGSPTMIGRLSGLIGFQRFKLKSDRCSEPARCAPRSTKC